MRLHRTERKSFLPMSLMSTSSCRDRSKYGGIWRRAINFFKGCSLSNLRWDDLSTNTSLCLQHEPYPAILISVSRGRRWRQRHRKTIFRSVLLNLMASKANCPYVVFWHCSPVATSAWFKTALCIRRIWTKNMSNVNDLINARGVY